VLELHPALRPRAYVNAAVDGTGVEIGSCDALDEGDELTWTALLLRGETTAIQAIVQAIDPRAVCEPVKPHKQARAAWSVRIEENAPGAGDSDEVRVTSFSKGAEFVFEPKEGMTTGPAKQAE
jgi:hypothetical protein